jgi:hypothetical protein
MKNVFFLIFILMSLNVATADSNETLSAVGSVPTPSASPQNLCVEKNLNPICKSAVKLKFKWSNDGEVASGLTIITKLSEKASATTGRNGKEYTIEVVPQYSAISSKEGLYMKVRLLIDQKLIAEPELFTKLGQQAALEIRNDPKFEGFENLELLVDANLAK